MIFTQEIFTELMIIYTIMQPKKFTEEKIIITLMLSLTQL